MRSREIPATTSAMLLTLLILTSGAYAKSKSGTFSGTYSGSFATIPLDIDNEGCTTVSGITTCTDLSTETNAAGTSKGILKGSFTHQAVFEAIPVAGSGCLIDSSVQSCTLGASTDACEATFVGGSFVNRDSDGDLTFGFATPGGSLCIDFSSPPFNFSETINWSITGGTGKLTGVTGTFSATGTGQFLSIDMQGHDFGWFTETRTGSATLP